VQTRFDLSVEPPANDAVVVIFLSHNTFVVGEILEFRSLSVARAYSRFVEIDDWCQWVLLEGLQCETC
jgi:hypothetical protein